MKRRIVNLLIKYWPFKGALKSYCLKKKFISQVRYKGTGIKIHDSISVIRAKGMILGNKVVFEGGNEINATAGLSIGDDVIISKGVSISTVDDDGNYNPVVIGNNNVISSNITAGTIIPNRSKIKSLLDYDGQMVFVVSTGRSGSKAIAQLIDQHQDAQCYHDAFPHLYRYANDLLYSKTSSSETIQRIKTLYSSISCSNTNVIGLSDQKIAPLISVLKQVFPAAKFIWVVRNAEKFINSSYPRGWFANEEFDLEENEKEFLERKAKPSRFDAKHRTNGSLVGAFNVKQWNEVTAFERNCWYWTYWNTLIENQLLNLDKKDWIMVRLNELNEKSADIQKFIGLIPQESSVGNVNSSSYVKPKRENWTSDMDDIFGKQCEALMKRLFTNNRID